MKKKIGDLTLNELADMCDNKCECKIWNICKLFGFHVFDLAFENEGRVVLEEEIEAKNENENGGKQNEI